MKPWEAAVAVIVVAILVGTTVLLYPPAAKSETSSSPTSSTSSSGTSTIGSNGLQLRLALNATSLLPGASLGVTVSEFNTEATANNVTKGALWAVQGLSLSACEGEENSVYPFGIAVYQGRYSAANVSQGTPLQIFPVVPCPMFIRLVTGYLFQPTSDSAVVLPSSGAAPTPMDANVTVSGEYSGASLKPLSAGVYTVVAGDEWGALETLQFTVSGQ